MSATGITARQWVELLWPTRVVSTPISAPLSSQAAAELGTMTAQPGIESLRAVRLEEMVGCSAQEVAKAIASALLPLDPERFSNARRRSAPGLTPQYWGPGYHTALRHSQAPWQGILFVGVRQPPGPRGRSGQLQVHDPRAGCGNVFAPGTPFGRPLNLEPEEGRLVLLPGWLEWSIQPLSPGHAMAVVLISVPA